MRKRKKGVLGRPTLPQSERLQQITVRIESDLLAWYDQATNRNRLMRQALRAYKEHSEQHQG